MDQLHELLTNMTTPFQPEDSKTNLGLPARPLVYDFAVLGLRSREARVEAIRDAAQRRAKSIQSASDMVADERQELLCELACSTYRVLDPRKRSKLMERIQLCLIGDGDFDMQQSARAPLLDPAPFVVAELVEVESNHEAQLRQAKREIVKFLTGERRPPNKTRVGAMVVSLVLAAVSAVGLIAAAILI